jgi:hypothetical protein
VSSSLGPEDSMLSTPLSFTEGTRTIGKVTRTNFEQSMKHLNSPLRMPRGKVGPKIEVNNRRRRPESKMKGAPVRKRNEELENEVNAFIAGVATRLTKSAMRYSPPRCVRLWHALLACSFAESFRSHRALSLPVSSGFPSLEQCICASVHSGLLCRNRRSSSQLAPLDSGQSSSSLSLAEGDFSYHERYAKSAAKLRRDRGQRRGTMSFIDDMLQARDDEQWILENPEKWMRIKQERGGPTPDALETDSWDGRIR